MGIFTRRKKEQEQPVEERAVKLGGLSFNSISSFSSEQAMRLSAVYCAVNQISNSLATLPIYIYKVDDFDSKVRVKHNLYSVLNMTPDKKYSHFQWMKQLVTSMYLRGNGYAYIQRDDQLNVVSLTYIDSDFVTPMVQKDGSVKYIVAGMNQAIDAQNMIHLYLYLDNTYRGISTIRYASQALETAAEAEKHASNFFKSGANLSGIIKASATLTNDQKKQIQDSWVSAFNSSANKVSVAVLPQGLDYQPISVSPEDAELLETRKYDVVNIARFFNISPIKLFDLGDVSYNSMEAAQLAYVSDTIYPVARLILDEFNRKLFKPSQTGKLVCDFDYAILMQSNKESEASYYKSMMVNGIMSLNEVRAKLGLEPVDELIGDKHWVQISYATMEDVASGKYVKSQSQDQNQNVDNQAKESDSKNNEPQKTNE